MKKSLLITIPIALLLNVGCASFKADLADISKTVTVEKNGSTNTASREITTRIKGTAAFSSAQTIEKLKALQTDKTQSIGTAAIGQHGATNVLESLETFLKILQELNKLKSPLPSLPSEIP